jgi:hypothetical protein
MIETSYAIPVWEKAIAESENIHFRRIAGLQTAIFKHLE